MQFPSAWTTIMASNIVQKSIDIARTNRTNVAGSPPKMCSRPWSEWMSSLLFYKCVWRCGVCNWICWRGDGIQFVLFVHGLTAISSNFSTSSSFHLNGTLFTAHPFYIRVCVCVWRYICNSAAHSAHMRRTLLAKRFKWRQAQNPIAYRCRTEHKIVLCVFIVVVCRMSFCVHEWLPIFVVHFDWLRCPGVSFRFVYFPLR